MTYGVADAIDDLVRVLGVTIPVESAEAPDDQANIMIAEIERLQAIEKAKDGAANVRTMDQMMYLVAPVADQCNWDEDGAVSLDLFVWARSPSEAIKLWRAYYDMEDVEPGDQHEEPILGIDVRVRVFEVPIMRVDAAPAAVKWDDIHSFGATAEGYSEI